MSATDDSRVDTRFDVRLPRHPYPGLRPFREDEWAIFFGRETIVDKVIDDLVVKRFVAMHGDSGSGKSSLVRAGVLPRLVQDLGRGGVSWRTASMEPGNAPMRHLATALAELCVGSADDARTRLRRLLNLGRDAAPAIVAELRRGESDHVCLLVDQFEEIFAFARDRTRAEAELFLEVLIGIQQQRPDGLHVILTMRSEYLGACARFSGLAETINDSQYLLPPISRQALVRGIREPAFLYGGRVTTELADRLIIDAGDSQDQLPLIQHALMVMQRSLPVETSADRHGGNANGASGWVLSLDRYDRTRGVIELLSDHADRILSDILNTHEHAGPVMEKVFRALTDIDADGHAIRRRQTLRQLADTTGIGTTELAAMLGPLRADGVSFLRPFGSETLAEHDEINISHEALIRCWKRIADPATGWLHKEFEEGLVWKTLLVAADGFATDKTAVLSPAVTVERAQWLSERNAAWARRYGGRFEDVKALLKASEANVRRQKRFRFFLAGALMGLVALTAYLYSSLTEREELKAALAEADNARIEADVAKQSLVMALLEATLAEKEAQANLDKFRDEQAKNQELRSQLLTQQSTEATAAGDAGAGLALSLAVLQDQPELPYLPEAESGAYAALFALRERSVLGGHEDAVVSVAFDNRGERVLTASRDGTARVWDASSGREVAVLSGHEGPLLSATWSEDGTRAVTTSFDGTARVWNMTDGNEPVILDAPAGTLYSAVFSPDGERVLTASGDRLARLWDVESGLPTLLFEGHVDRVTSARVSMDGQHVVTASQDATARVWDAKAGQAVAVLSGHEGAVNTAVFSPDGTRVLTTSEDGTARLWDALSGASLRVFEERVGPAARLLEGNESRILSAVFSPDGRRILTTLNDGTGRVRDAASGRTMAVLSGHTGTITSAAFSDDGEEILTGSEDGTLRVWNTDTGEPAFVLAGHDGPVRSVAYGPDGTRMVSAADDSSARLWSASTALSMQRAGPSVVSRSVKEIVAQTSGYGTKSDSSDAVSKSLIALSPDGDRVLRASAFGQVGTWHPNEGQELVADRTPEGGDPRVVAAGFAGTRDVVILAPNDAQQRASRTSGSGTPGFEFRIGTRPFPASSTAVGVPDDVAFAPASNRAALYFSGSGSVELYDMTDRPTLVASVRVMNSARTVDVARYRLAFHPDGDVVAGVSERGDSVFAIDWPSDRDSTSAEGEPIRLFDVDVQPLQSSPGPNLSAILALHADRESLSVVAVPATRDPDALIVGDLLNDEPFQTLRPGPNERRPTAAAFDTDGRRVVLVSEQGVALYSRDRAGMIARFALAGKRMAAASIAADGKAIAATSDDGTIGYWPIFPGTDELKAFATRIAPRQLSPEQVEAYLVTPTSSGY